eukprot:gene10072-7969_t
MSALSHNTMHAPQAGGDKSIWIFGYGSLIHNPGFEHSQKVEGCIKGWKRVFWQGSTDHRGTPEKPGRTVTLHESESCITWGAAYELAGDFKHQQETLKYLEWREKQYDVRHTADILDADGNVLVKDCLVYIASPNKEKNYLFKLAESMRKMNIHDQELFHLEDRVKVLVEQQVQA